MSTTTGTTTYTTDEGRHPDRFEAASRSTDPGSRSATDPGSRSAAEIEREVEATRAGLTDTLGELRDRATPGQLFEQALDYARSSGGAEMLRNLGVAVRDNPLPLLLIGAGIGWLALGGGGTPRSRHVTGAGFGGHAAGATGDAARRMSASVSDTAHRAADATRRASEGASDTAHRVAAGASDAAHRVAESVSGTARSVGEGVSGAARSVGEGVSGAARQVSEGISDAASAGAHYASDVGRGVGEYAGGAAEAVARLAREQPLVLGAIGFALGATVGALLPGTDTEDRLMGETRDAALERARASAEQGYERVKDTAREHLDRAREDDGAERLSAVGGALSEAARVAADAVKDAAHDLAGRAKSAMGAADEGARREENRPGAAARPTPDPRRPGPV